MRYGFIGCGNMGGAVARAVCRGAGAGQVVLANRTAAKAEALAKELGCTAAGNEAAAACDFVFLGVKPQMMAGVLAELAPRLAARTDPFVLVSMAAGLSMQRLRQMAGGEYPIVRMMPNTPVAVGAGMIQYCSLGVPADRLETWRQAMAPAGRLEEVAEGRRLQPRRVHDPGGAGAGGAGLPRRRDRRGAGRLRKDRRDGQGMTPCHGLRAGKENTCESLSRSAQARWPTRAGG